MALVHKKHRLMELTSQFSFEKAKPREAFSVSQFIDILNQKIKPVAARIIGEVSEAKSGPTGHVYFSLKDEKNGNVLSCVIWRSRYEMYGIKLAVGMKIIASGHAEIYPPSGRLSFIADSIEPAGEGALKKEYDRLLKILADEGIFDPARKRKIPACAKRVGVITSKQGAVIHDFLTNLGKFGFCVEMIDSRVEGQLAVGDLLASIRTFKKRDIEVLVVIRGGGSLEALMAFNNEMVVREIAAFPVPVIAGIGHDKDVPLAAMAADIAVSTPTAAANLLSQSWEELSRTLERHQAGIMGGYKNRLLEVKFRLNRHAQTFNNFKYILRDIGTLINDCRSKSIAGMKLFILAAKQQLEYLEKAVRLNDPQRPLKLGYSIVKAKGNILKSIKSIGVGDQIDIMLADGSFNSQVKKINNTLK